MNSRAACNRRRSRRRGRGAGAGHRGRAELCVRLVFARRNSRGARRAGGRGRGVPGACAADPDDRHGAGVRLMRLGAVPREAMPQAYVRSLFDQYAPRFDAELTERLHYRAPALLLEAVLAVRAAASKPAFFKRAIDLGCGTGLGAAALAKQRRDVHRHRSLARDDRAGPRHWSLCCARGRRHDVSARAAARCGADLVARGGCDGLCRRARAGAGRNSARADAGRLARIHGRDP